LTTEYTVARVDAENDRTFSDVTVHNQRGELVSVATHILKRV
jgi:hypothetical protein